MTTENTASPEQDAIPVLGLPRLCSQFMSPSENNWNIVLQQVGKKLRKNGFGVSIAQGLEDAAKHVMETLLPESAAKVVSFGGSMSVRESGLLEAMKKKSELNVMDTFDMSIGLPAMMELRRQALLCDLFICSANALTRDGELILVDAFGNRTAAVQFGPRKVVLLVGRNKICATLEEGLDRIKGLAAPANVQRLGKKTPCAKTGYCMDCNSPDRICSVWTVVKRCLPKERIHVVLINENAGY